MPGKPGEWTLGHRTKYSDYLQYSILKTGDKAIISDFIQRRNLYTK